MSDAQMGRSDASERWRSRKRESARPREKLPYAMTQWLGEEIQFGGELETQNISGCIL